MPAVNDDEDATSVILRIDSREDNTEAGGTRRPVKLAKDGETVLVPQPNEDPLNPVSVERCPVAPAADRRTAQLVAKEEDGFAPRSIYCCYPSRLRIGYWVRIYIHIYNLSCILTYLRAVALVLQGEEWHMSPNTVNHSQSGNVFMLGAG